MIQENQLESNEEKRQIDDKRKGNEKRRKTMLGVNKVSNKSQKLRGRRIPTPSMKDLKASQDMEVQGFTRFKLGCSV